MGTSRGNPFKAQNKHFITQSSHLIITEGNPISGDYCYGLKVCVLPNPDTEILTSSVMVLGGRAFGDEVRGGVKLVPL